MRVVLAIAAYCFVIASAWSAAVQPNSTSASATWFVDDDASPPFLGTAQQPFAQIADAIASPQVVNGDVVSVAPGSYAGFQFAGKAVTVRSQSGAGMTSVGPVEFVNGETASSVLEGFRVVGGSGTLIGSSNGPTWAGGCILSFGSPTVQNCVLTGGSVEPLQSSGGNALGGAVYTTGPATLFDCTIADNRARGVDEGYAAGGGVYGPARLTNCTVERNEVWGDPVGSWTGDPVCGGGTAHATLEQCVVRSNTVNGPNTTGASTLRGHAEGGGVYGGSAVACTIEDNEVFAQARDDFVDTDLGFGGGAARSTLAECIVRNNRVLVSNAGLHGPDIGGGGVHSGSAVRCAIIGNVVASSFGGGKSAGGGANRTVLGSCVLRDNVADWGAGVQHASGAVRRCTLYHNQAWLGGGGANDCAQLDSSILWANSPTQISGSSPTVLTYCDVEDPSWASGTNFTSDPRFWNAVESDLHLRPGSPCIDSGNPQLPLDADGTSADVGALAFDPNYCTSPIVYCTAKTNSLGCVPQIAGFGGSYGDPWSPSLWIICTQVLNQKTGILFYGHHGRASATFLGGTLCVAPPTVRTALQFSGGSTSVTDCSGAYAFDFGAWILSGEDPSLIPGEQINAQYWSRDPLALFAAGLSDAAEFVVCN